MPFYFKKMLVANPTFVGTRRISRVVDNQQVRSPRSVELELGWRRRGQVAHIGRRSGREWRTGAPDTLG